jgi:hypothetical protein
MCFGVRIVHCKPYLLVRILITTIFKELTWWSPIFEVGEVLTLSSASSEKRLCWGACSPANWRCVARDPEGPQDRTSHCKAASSLEARLVRLVTCLTTDPTNFTAPKMMKQRIQGIFHQGEPGGFHFRKGRIRDYLHGFAMFRKIYRWQAAGTAGTARNRYVCIISHLSQNHKSHGLFDESYPTWTQHETTVLIASCGKMHSLKRNTFNGWTDLGCGGCWSSFRWLLCICADHFFEKKTCHVVMSQHQSKSVNVSSTSSKTTNCTKKPH